MESFRFWALRLVFCGVAALAGCSTARPPILPETLPEERRPLDDLLGNLARRNTEFKSLRSLASVVYTGPEGRQSFQEIVVVRRPDRRRLARAGPAQRGRLEVAYHGPELTAALAPALFVQT